MMEHAQRRVAVPLVDDARGEPKIQNAAVKMDPRYVKTLEA